MQSTLMLLLALSIVLGKCFIYSQAPDDPTWEDLIRKGKACKSNTCRKIDTACECFLTIEHRLTMMNDREKTLLRPKNGRFVRYNDSKTYTMEEEISFISADGYGSRMVLAVNRMFPGPPITAYENQEITLHMWNKMHTDSTTIHLHGIHQKSTPWSDGVAFVTQCPILPGQIYTVKFNAKPYGTSFYHAHIGDQRSAGLYGPLIIIPLSSSKVSQPQDDNTEKVHVVSIQDWNHNDDPETLYQRMLFGNFDLDKNKVIDTTSDISGAKFSRFHCHSGLINGKGRFYTQNHLNNAAPLTRFDVVEHSDYRFRVISAATLYPFRVYLQGHRSLSIVASDGFEISPIEVESFIIHPGERIDFLVRTDKSPGTYLLVAETIETEPEIQNQYHAAEAIVHYTNAHLILNPPKATPHRCTDGNVCRIFNCPYLYYPKDQYKLCFNWNHARSIDPNSNTDEVKGAAIERFYNFAFPGDLGNTPGSVNGRQFIPPTVAAYAEWNRVSNNCQNCSEDSVCECTYYDTIDRGDYDQVYQFVITNIGSGSGWSHPIHLHGHSFYVLKMGFAEYDMVTAKLKKNMGQDQIDLICNDSKNFCNAARWRNSSWENGNHPFLNWNDPPQKDTIIVPTGGYVVIRFKADNPGLWFFHCHIDLHNTNGMGMMINESPNYHKPVPKGFPTCGNYIRQCNINGTFN